MKKQNENLIKQSGNLDQPIFSTSLREKSLEWFFAKSEVEKNDLKEKHLKNMPVQYDSKWGFHFTFGQIEEMYKSEHP
jgi:hypothetical protein